MKRVLLALAILGLGVGGVEAQTVPDSSQAAKVQPAYRRTPTFRLDPFRQAMIPHWGFVFSAGALGENNTLNVADARAAIYLANKDSLAAGDALNILGLIPDGKGLRGSASGEGGLSLGGPFGSHVNLVLSAQGRGYGFFQLDDNLVALLRDGNASRPQFSVGNSKGAALATAEAGAHAVLRFGPLGSEDGVNLNLGFGARYIRPLAFAQARTSATNSGVIVATGDSVYADVGAVLARTPDIDSTWKGSKASLAGDFLVRLTWPTQGFALEAMVANLGHVTVHHVETDTYQFKVNTTKLTAVRDSIDSLRARGATKDSGDVRLTLPRIVRFTASAWANRILQVDVSATMPVHGDFEQPLTVDLGTTWRFVRTIPLRAGIVLGGDQGLGFTGGLAIEGRNMYWQFMGESLGGLFRNATGVGGRFELGVFF
jgi:hypothetical protein